MKLKNYQEDIVLHVIDIVMEDREDLPRDDRFVTDVAAYALNRIPPKYIMSDRGFTRFVPSFLLNDTADESTIELFKILAIVNEAVDVIINRRSRGKDGDLLENAGHARMVELSYWHNYPQIIGKIIDKDSRKPVVDASIAVYIDDELAEPATSGWNNPSVTIAATKGYYSFWPKARLSKGNDLVSVMRLKVSHADYHPFEVVNDVQTTGEFEQIIEISTSRFLQIDPILLEKK